MRKRPLLVLFFTIFLDMLGVGILIPVIPALFAEPGAPQYILDPGTTKQVGYLLLGVLSALYSIGQFTASPVIGQWSDKTGRKKLLIFSIFGSALAHGLFALGIFLRSIPLLFFARTMGGLTAGNIVVAQASIADVTKPEDRAKNFGLIGAAFGLGFIIGPFLGGILADPTIVPWFNSTIPFIFAMFLSLLNAFSVMRFLPETNTRLRPDFHIRWSQSLHNIKHAWNMVALRKLFISNFLFQTGFTFYVTFTAVFLITRFGFSQSAIGNYFAYVGVWIVFTQGVLTRFVSGKISETKILERSMFIVAFTILAILLIPSSAWLYFVVPFFAMAVGLTQSNITGLISRSARPEVQGEVLGVNGSVTALAMSLPPLLSGIVAASFSYESPLIISAMVILGAGLYFVFHEKMFIQQGSPH